MDPKCIAEKIVQYYRLADGAWSASAASASVAKKVHQVHGVGARLLLFCRSDLLSCRMTMMTTYVPIYSNSLIGQSEN